MAKSLNEALKYDRKTAVHTLGSGPFSPTTLSRQLGWRYQYRSRLIDRFNATLAAVAQQPNKQYQKARLVGLAQFVMSLEDGYSSLAKQFKQRLKPHLSSLTPQDFQQHGVYLNSEFKKVLSSIENKRSSPENRPIDQYKNYSLIVDQLNDPTTMNVQTDSDEVQLVLWGKPMPSKDLYTKLKEIDWHQLAWGTVDIDAIRQTIGPVVVAILNEAHKANDRKQVRDIFATVPARLLEDFMFSRQSHFQPSTNSQGNSDVSVEDASDNDLNSRQSVVGITTDVTNSGTEVSNATDSSVAAQMLDIDAQLSFLPEMLEFQPDLAVNVMDALVNAENKKMKSALTQYVTPLASLTNWLINGSVLPNLYKSMSFDDQCRFLNLVLIQDDTAGQRFFSNLSQDDKRDVFTTINHALSNSVDQPFAQPELEKAIFYLFGYTDHTYKSLSPTERRTLIQTERFRTQLPKRPMVDHLPESVQEGAFNTMTIEEGGFNPNREEGPEITVQEPEHNNVSVNEGVFNPNREEGQEITVQEPEYNNVSVNEGVFNPNREEGPEITVQEAEHNEVSVNEGYSVQTKIASRNQTLCKVMMV